MVATMTWLTDSEYLCHKWPRIWSTFMTYHWVCSWSNTTGATSGAGTAYPSGAPSSPPVFLRGLCCSFFSFLCSGLLIVVCHFVHCVVCPSSIYGFWLPLWYLHTLLVTVCCELSLMASSKA